MNDNTCDPIVRCLTGDATPRVWSLLVTVFGDLALQQGAQISGRTLGRLTEAIGIKPEALRVALHRLRKDGWIESTRSGRESLHGLSDWGYSQSAAAMPRIYDTNANAGDAWLSVFERNVAPRDSAAGHWVSTNILISADAVTRANAFTSPVVPKTGLPLWMSHKICSPDSIHQTQDLVARLENCSKLVTSGPALTVLQSAVLRILVVHEWRRIILKLPDLPDYTFPPEWPGQTCRDQVGSLLKDYPRIGLAVLERERV